MPVFVLEWKRLAAGRRDASEEEVVEVGVLATGEEVLGLCVCEWES